MSGPVIGIDLGGTKVAAAALDGGTLGESVVEPTDGCSTDALLDQLVEIVERTRGAGRSRRSGSACRRWSSSTPGGSSPR